MMNHTKPQVGDAFTVILDSQVVQGRIFEVAGDTVRIQTSGLTSGERSDPKGIYIDEYDDKTKKLSKLLRASLYLIGKEDLELSHDFDWYGFQKDGEEILKEELLKMYILKDMHVMAASQHSSLGATNNGSWLGSTDHAYDAYYVYSNGSVRYSFSRYHSCVVAPAFDLKASDIIYSDKLSSWSLNRRGNRVKNNYINDIRGTVSNIADLIAAGIDNKSIRDISDAMDHLHFAEDKLL